MGNKIQTTLIHIDFWNDTKEGKVIYCWSGHFLIIKKENPNYIKICNLMEGNKVFKIQYEYSFFGHPTILDMNKPENFKIKGTVLGLIDNRNGTSDVVLKEKIDWNLCIDHNDEKNYPKENKKYVFIVKPATLNKCKIITFTEISEKPFVTKNIDYA